MSVIYIDPFQFGGYDPDAQDYITRVIAADVAAGNTSGLEVGVQGAINTFVVGCKADGIWNAIKASCILAGARTLAGALVPLVGTAPDKYGTEGGWNYNRETGLQGNGTDNYLDSNRNNNADPQNSNHNAVYATVIASSGSYINARGAGGLDTGTNAMGAGPFFRSRTSTAQVYSSSATGLIASNRNSSSGYSARFGGINNTVSTVSQTPLNANLFVFARNTVGTPEFFGDGRLSFYSIGEALDLALLDARVTALMTALGAAIP